MNCQTRDAEDFERTGCALVCAIVITIFIFVIGCLLSSGGQ